MLTFSRLQLDPAPLLLIWQIMQRCSHLLILSSLLEHVIFMSLLWAVRSFVTILTVGISCPRSLLRSVLPILESLLSLAGTQGLGGEVCSKLLLLADS